MTRREVAAFIRLTQPNLYTRTSNCRPRWISDLSIHRKIMWSYPFYLPGFILPAFLLISFGVISKANLQSVSFKSYSMENLVLLLHVLTAQVAV